MRSRSVDLCFALACVAKRYYAMGMDRIAMLASALIGLALAAGCCKSGLHGSGTARTETRSVGAFQEVAVSGTYVIDIAIGNPPSVVVTGDDNLLSHIETTVADKRLSIRSDTSLDPRTELKLTIVTPELTAVRVSGANHAAIRGVKGDSFRLDIDGASDLRAEGTTKRLDVVASGASSVDTRGLLADSVTIRVSGAGSYDVFAKSALDASASGAATISYFGHPASVKRDASGAATIEEK